MASFGGTVPTARPARLRYDLCCFGVVCAPGCASKPAAAAADRNDLRSARGGSAARGCVVLRQTSVGRRDIGAGGTACRRSTDRRPVGRLCPRRCPRRRPSGRRSRRATPAATFRGGAARPHATPRACFFQCSVARSDAPVRSVGDCRRERERCALNQPGSAHAGAAGSGTHCALKERTNKDRSSHVKSGFPLRSAGLWSRCAFVQSLRGSGRKRPRKRKGTKVREELFKSLSSLRVTFASSRLRVLLIS